VPRYVLGDTWWQIERDDAALVIGTGTVGTAGTERIRRYKTPGHAEIQYDVMIREKVAAGFALDTSAGAPAAGAEDAEGAPEHTELEAAIAADPYAPDAYGVYGDLLQRRGDPRGELIALQLAEDKKPGDARLVAAIGRMIETHRAALLGPLAPHAGKLREFADGPFAWRFGFIHIAQLDRGETGEPVPEIVDELLRHPSGRFVAEICVRDDVEAEVAALIDLLARRPPASLRAIDLASIGDFGDLGLLLRAHPRLRRLAIRGRVGGPELAPLGATLRSIAAAALPSLEELELRLVNRDARFAQLRPLLRRADLPALSRLRLRSADFPNEIVAELLDSPLAAQLTVLDLGLSELGDRGVRRLAAARDRFPKLREVVVTRGEVSRSAIEELAAAVKKVTLLAEDPDDEDRFADGDYYDEIVE
jgi:uncharacterized protein (TIGR02996 family)